MYFLCFFFFNDTATTEIYTLSLHDALPIWSTPPTGTPHSFRARTSRCTKAVRRRTSTSTSPGRIGRGSSASRSEEHTSELQSRQYLVCRLLLEKKNKNTSEFSSYQNPLERT